MRSNSEFNAVRQFQRQLARYLAYRDEFPNGADLLTVSFQCVSGSQEKELAEIVGIIKC